MKHGKFHYNISYRHLYYETTNSKNESPEGNNNSQLFTNFLMNLFPVYLRYTPFIDLFSI